jgi:hypothetical protein
MRIIAAVVLVIAWALAVPATARPGDPREIITTAIARQDSVPPYEVGVHIEVDVPSIRIPVKTATLVRDPSGAVTVTSDEFVMVPKHGLDQSIRDLVASGYDAVLTGSDSTSGTACWVVKIIPFHHDRIVLSTLWIDQGTSLVTRAETHSRSGGKYVAEISYYPGIGVPRKVDVAFEVKEFKLPLDMVNRTIGVDEESMERNQLKTGRISITFGEYRFREGPGG